MRDDAQLLKEDVSVEGELEAEGLLRPVKISYASRLTLSVCFRDGIAPADGTVFERVWLRLGEEKVQLGRARLSIQDAREGYDGRLVFLDDVYDCRALLFERRRIELRARLRNIPVMLAAKEGIKGELREYCASLTYDLSVYQKFFEEQDRVLCSEEPEVAEVARRALIQSEGPGFFRYLDERLDELEKLVAGFDREEHERHGFYFRRQVWHYILASEFLKRTNLKPRGYAGDAEMMMMAYDNQYVGEGIFNRLMHKHPLETKAAQAVRNRRRLVSQLMRSAFAHYPLRPPDGFRVLSVAAGPAAELLDIFVGGEDPSRIQVALLDQDAFALEHARRNVQKVEALIGAPLKVEYLNQSVRTMLRTPRLRDVLGQFHFIYSMGLFDYLTPPVARAVLVKMFDLLQPGGTMLVGNFHVKHATRLYMEYWMDWSLFCRTEDEFVRLAEGLAGAEASLFFEDTRSQMFLRLDKHL